MIKMGHSIRSSQRGFNLVELLIAMALMSIGFAIIVTMFVNGWQLWRRSYTELMLQREAREAMTLIARTLREASPGTVRIDTPTGAPKFSKIAFTDARNKGWIFKMTDDRLEHVTTMANGMSATIFMMRDVSSIIFTYPSFQDRSLIDIGLTCTKVPYGTERPLVVQVVERVIMRNP
jgi:prepilin-type N-terminal cleavage/methylation domain-containing protein